jgi:hypothetical protein
MSDEFHHFHSIGPSSFDIRQSSIVIRQSSFMIFPESVNA